MVKEESPQEFTIETLEAKTQRVWRDSRDTLQLARLIARRTKIIIGLAVVAVMLLVVAIYMLWRMAEHLPI
jgi:hypothetical protein